MKDDSVIPTADVILRPALEKMYEKRPSTYRHLNYRTGRYWLPFLAYRSQAARMVRRLAALMKANSLAAEGDELREYVASEYDAVPETDQTFAVGSVSLTRVTTTSACDIPRGTKLTRAPNVATQIPLVAATYETVADARFAAGTNTLVDIPIRAVSPGSSSNHPIRTDTSASGVTVSLDRISDKTVTVSAFSAAGGSDGPDDDYVRDFAQAYGVGQYGPTEAESRYGALRGTGVRNILVYDLPATGVEKILVADSSWASSSRWCAAVQQNLYDSDLVGFGCRVDVDVVQNKVVTVDATVVLRDSNYLTETTDVSAEIREAVRRYLDERVDWNVWTESGLKSAISQAHPKVFYCSSVTMKDLAGNVLSEIISPDLNATQFHFYLANGAVDITYQSPT